MNKWIEERKTKQIKNAMESAVRQYARIETEGRILEKLDEMLLAQDIDFEKMLERFNVYSADDLVQIYTWNTKEEDKEMADAFLIAMVEQFGSGERKRVANDIKYVWKDAVDRTRIEFQVPPAISGCKLVEKMVVVPAQPATTRIEYEIECTEKVK